MPEFVECPEVEEFFFGSEGIAQHGSLRHRRLAHRRHALDHRRILAALPSRSAPRLPGGLSVAEDWGNATHRLLGDSFDATMNYRFGYSVVGFAGGKLTPASLMTAWKPCGATRPFPTSTLR